MTGRPHVVELALLGDLHLLNREALETQNLHGALCNPTNAEIFYAEAEELILRAKSICLSCPVKNLCLTQGANDTYGIYGGLTPTERGVPSTLSSLGGYSLNELNAEKSYIQNQSVSSVATKYRVQPRTVQRWRKILKLYDAKEQRETQR